jgi:hypothetical protein
MPGKQGQNVVTAGTLAADCEGHLFIKSFPQRIAHQMGRQSEGWSVILALLCWLFRQRDFALMARKGRIEFSGALYPVLDHGDPFPPDRQQAKQSSEMPGQEFHDFSLRREVFFQLRPANLGENGERKLSKMKKQNPLTKLTLLFAVLLTLGAARAQADILPAVSIGFSPVGLTMDQTARLNLVNLDVPNGIFINWGFIDANGVTLARSAVTLPLGKIVSVDFMRQMGPGSVYVRAEVRVQVDILTPNVPGESLRRSLEVFNNDTGATTVCLGGGGL